MSGRVRPADGSIWRAGCTAIDSNATTSDDARVVELERRIEELETLDEARFGRFTRWDWLICLSLAVVLPLLLVWGYAP